MGNVIYFNIRTNLPQLRYNIIYYLTNLLVYYDSSFRFITARLLGSLASQR